MSNKSPSEASLQPVANPSWERTKQNAHLHFRNGLTQIERAVIEERRVNRNTREFLNSKKSQLSAVLKSAPTDYTAEQVFGIRDQMPMWQEAESVVRWRFEEKRSGGQRVICSLPPALKASHRLLAHALRAQMLPSQQLFGLSSPKIPAELRQFGYSRNSAMLYIRKLKFNKFHHMAELDIVDCFPSYNPDALYELSLPKEVIKNTLDNKHIQFRQKRGRNNSIWSHDDCIVNGTPHGLRGLMQGSPVSSIILAIALNRVLNSLPKCSDTKVIVCFDNFVIASRTAAGLQSMINSLAGVLRQCREGPFELHPPIYSTEEGFDFMGYRLSANGMHIGISPDRFEKLDARLDQLESLSKQNPRLDMLKIWRAIVDFANGYSIISDAREELSFYLESFELTLTESDRDDLVTFQNMLFFPKGTCEYEFVNKCLRV